MLLTGGKRVSFDVAQNNSKLTSLVALVDPKMESTVRYLDIEVGGAFEISTEAEI